MNAELQSFVKQALEKNISREQIKTALEKAGWELEEINAALDTYVDGGLSLPVPKRHPYLSAREAFLYLVLFLALYVSAISLGILLFQFINRAWPDPAAPYEIQGSIDTIRSATASIIITYPIYLFVTWFLARTFAKHPEKRGSKVRKWLTYITLFVAAAISIVDLITLVNSILSGELTLRFILKVLTVLLIAGSVFGFYLWDLRKEEKEI